MKTVEDIVKGRKEAAAASKDRAAFFSGIDEQSHHMAMNFFMQKLDETLAQSFQALGKELAQQIEKIEVNPPDVHVNVPPLKQPTVTISEAALAKLPLKDLPEIKLPAPIVHVTVPEIEIPPLPRPEVIVQRQEEKVEPRLIAEDYRYNAKGQLSEVIERYEDGSQVRCSGIDTGNIRYAYS